LRKTLDVTDINRRPILFFSFVIQKQREIAQGRRRDVDGSVATGQRPGPASPRSGGQQ
jgi:hypothetical protein